LDQNEDTPMETLTCALSGAAFFLWLAAIASALVASSDSQRESKPATQRKGDELSPSYRWQFE
jgi:hypothetical protein